MSSRAANLSMMQMKTVSTSIFAKLSRTEIHALADELLCAEPGIIETCVQFVCADTFGCWHGRARAMLCRRLKHVQLTPQQQERLTKRILNRLASGQFSEQFKDQLRLVLSVDAAAAFAAARGAAASSRLHVRRYAEWVLAHDARPASKHILGNCVVLPEPVSPG